MRKLLIFFLTLPLLASISCLAENSDSPILQAESPYNMEITIEHLKDAILAHQYKIVRIQNSLDGLSVDKKGPVIIYFCNFHFLHNALERNKHIGPLLPCHVVVSEENGKVHVYAPNPKIVGAAFEQDNKFLTTLCYQVTQDYKDILWEGTI